MKSPSLFKVAVIIVTVWIIYIYQQYLHTTTHYLQTNNYYASEFDPMMQRRIPPCSRDDNNNNGRNTERFDLDRSSTKDDTTTTTLEPKCRHEFHRVTIDYPDHVPGLTSEDYERSIAHVGNRYRIAMFVQKLIQSTQSIAIRPITNTTSTKSSTTNDAKHTRSSSHPPVTVIVCGGSITMGHGVEPQSGRYSDALEVWLNTVYPVATTSVDNNNNPTTKAPHSDADYNFRNDHPNRHRVFMRGGHGANVRFPIQLFFLLW